MSANSDKNEPNQLAEKNVALDVAAPEKPLNSSDDVPANGLAGSTVSESENNCVIVKKRKNLKSDSFDKDEEEIADSEENAESVSATNTSLPANKTDEDDKREDCKYGVNCYQKNPAHKAKYRHPPKEVDHANNKRKQTENMTDNHESIFQKRNHRISIMSSDKKHVEQPKMIDVYEDRIELAEQREHAELLKDPKLFIKYKFLVDMPPDFYSFWDFCKSVATGNEKPEDVFKQCGLLLVGPFDVLADKFNNAPRYFPGQYLRHWRFFYDTPEFQTIIVKEKSCLHYGYWRDQPDSKNCFIAKNNSSENCEITLTETNIFSAMLKILDNDVDLTPFNRPFVAKMKKSIENWISAQNLKLQKFEELSKSRNKDVVTKTFHKAGIVVPFDRDNAEGYRPLLESDSKLKKILQKFSEIEEGDEKLFDAALVHLQPIITAAYIAVDEMDFGTALELGINLFCHGTRNLHDVLRPLLITGYTMTQRPQYIAIMKSHLEDRRSGNDLDILMH